MRESRGQSEREGNPYSGLLDPWKVELIRRRARACGFRRHELDDVLQDVVPVIRSFRYDAAHPSQASEQTALCAVVDGQLWSLRRKHARYRKHVTAFREGQRPLDGREKSVARSAAAFPTDDRTVDVAALLAALPSDERRVCEMLAQGASIAQVARRLGWGWHRVRRVIEGIRSHPHARHLEDYL
jgi:hypothetical protein